MDASAEKQSNPRSGGHWNLASDYPCSCPCCRDPEWQRAEPERRLHSDSDSTAGERYARGELTYASQWEPAAPQHWSEMPDIPEFLRRAREHESVH